MKNVIFIIFIFLGFLSYSQARLNISSGSSVYFHFNSYQKYVDGVTYSNFTNLSVYYNDTTVANTFPNWRIDVKALTPLITGDAGNTLDLNILELSATTSAGGVSYGTLALTNSDVTLLDGVPGTDPGTASVLVSYYCGVTNSLLQKNSDYYVVDILFTLMGE